jgi:ABC-2 type transport system ATP-binding protein
MENARRAQDPAHVEDAIHVEDLRVVRGGNEVLHGITLTVPRGSVTGLLGPAAAARRR